MEGTPASRYYSHTQSTAGIRRMRRRMVGRAISSFVALFVAFGQALAQAPACDQVEVPRLVDAPVSPPDSSARGGSYWDWSHAFERETTGVGVLSPSTRGNGGPPGYDWLPEVSLPLYARAGEAVPSGSTDLHCQHVACPRAHFLCYRDAASSCPNDPPPATEQRRIDRRPSPTWRLQVAKRTAS